MQVIYSIIHLDTGKTAILNQYIYHTFTNTKPTTGIDYFTKKVFGCPLRNKTDDSVVDGLEFCIKSQMENTYPHLIQSDNGQEFKNYVMKDWCRSHDIKQIFTDTHQQETH